jgi:8-oxo-dGTP pyrophosphatase MutT (NUDIX family)
MSVDAAPPRRQRIAAYAVLTRGGGSEREILLTRMSDRTRIRGRWTLPGGGIDHGEDPRDALRREVYEETGLNVEPGPILDVHATHFTGPRSDGLVEDYHGIHLIFAAELTAGSGGEAPHVVEQDGTTESAAWVRISEAPDLDLLTAARHALALVSQEC